MATPNFARNIAPEPGLVSFKWDASDAGLRLAYIGLPEDLVACGAAERSMIDISNSSTRRRTDSRGHYFERKVRVRRNPMREDLRILRVITDLEFAKTLPFVPRGLRFSRLDWLDRNPGKVHIEPDEKGVPISEGVRARRVRYAGRPEALSALEFPIGLFSLKFRASRGFRHYIGKRDKLHRDRPNAALPGWSVLQLMRGYFEIETYECVEEERPAEPKPPALRLVVDNTHRAK